MTTMEQSSAERKVTTANVLPSHLVRADNNRAHSLRVNNNKKKKEEKKKKKIQVFLFFFSPIITHFRRGGHTPAGGRPSS
jgi:hypothetical protein